MRLWGGETWLPEGLVFEATAPDAAFDNVMRCVEANVPAVTGTTVSSSDQELEAAAGAKSTAFWSTNFSPGVHALNQRATRSRNFEKIPGYRAQIHEVHHPQKRRAEWNGHHAPTACRARRFLKRCPSKATEGKWLVCMLWHGTLSTMPLFCNTKPNLVWGLPKAPWALRWTWQRHLERDLACTP